jgi:hypothetical protein
MARVSPITWAPQIDISPIPAEEHAAVKHVINLLMLLANYERNFRIAVALFDGSHAEKSRLARRSNHPWPRLRNYPANPYFCETFPINAAPAEFVHRSVDRARSKRHHIQITELNSGTVMMILQANMASRLA